MRGAEGQGRRKVLIVDDQRFNIRLMAGILDGDQHELLFATDGEQALEMASAQGVDLVLLDVVMPGIDGYEVCRRLKDNDDTRTIPVIFVTSMSEVDDEAKGFDVGGVDYITKPLSPRTVRARVRTHLELKHARDLLERLSLIDALTGIANRRRFDEHCDLEWRRCKRSGSPLSLLLVDVDFFKQFNDTYGHARGDECLQRIARVLGERFRRPSDLVARYGGEEFGVVLPDTDGPSARWLMERALADVRGMEIEHGHSSVDPKVTISLGGVSQVPSSESHSTTLAKADDLLYAAKEGGRNRGMHLDADSGERCLVLEPDAD